MEVCNKKALMKNGKTYLLFDFYINADFKEISEGIRMSLWQEGLSTYLMPGEFTLVEAVDQKLQVKLAVLDPKDFIGEALINEKFLFGHPKKIFGYGILKKIL